MKKFSIILFVILLSGCSIIKEPEKIVINSYLIEAKPLTKSYNTKKIDILINKPKIDKSFNTRDIIYTLKPFSYEAYGKSQWLEMPSNMIKTELIETIRDSKYFKNVVDIHSNAQSDYILESSFSKIYHKYESKKSFAILKANFKLIYKNKIIKSMTFNKKVLCKENTPYGFVKALNKGFNQVLNQLVEEIVK